MKGEKEHFVFERMPLLLYCGARGYPVPWVAWIWNDQVLQNSTDGPDFLLRHRVTTKEAGSYTCMAGNYLGVANYTYQVTVKVHVPARESKTTSGTHSTDDEPTRESKATSGTHSTVDELTREPTFTSGTHSIDPTKGDVQGSSSLATGIVIGILIGVGIAATLVCAYIYYTCGWKKHESDPSQEGLQLAHGSGGGDDDDDDVDDDNDGDDDDDDKKLHLLSYEGDMIS
ncbi:Roundabout 4 [Desmophyllum pertusum]|uniref:Roundabout 4 n=1 Tax=Desmophyllum pertusum TaxID=174260 RepID=A0A9X0A0Q3_9CNID|nr:Roundabout 4 [Desmophyllum pertusum]